MVVNCTPLAAGDGLGVENERELAISGDREGSFLLFDLA